jgi:hypothetical protein
MMESVFRESRLLALCAILIAGFGAVVAVIALANGQFELLLTKEFSSLIAVIWMIGLGFVFCAYAVDLILRRRPKRPLLTLIADVRENVLRPDWLIARATVFAAWYFLMMFFTPMKIMLGHVRGFTWDAALMQADRALFLGTDPWRITHALFGNPLATFALHLAYNMWFILMWLSIMYFTLKPDQVLLRARYIVSFLLCWMLVGSAAAWAFASAGPCYYERVFGDAYFEPLMGQLHEIDAELGEWIPGFGVQALRTQDMLWAGFTSQQGLFGGGISAAPSMHVALSVLMACAAWQVSRRLGWTFTAFAFVIWIGSIHLGWHYAMDGILALPLTLVAWRLGGWLVDRFVMREAPAAAMRPALAE